MSKLSLIFVACFLVSINIAKSEHPKSFQESKKVARIIWASYPETIYCGCKYDEQD